MNNLFIKQRKLTTAILISIAFVILFSFFVSATANWNQYGNSVQYNQLYNSYLFMGSNSPTGTLNYTEFLITTGSVFTPLIIDFNNDFEQDIAQYSGQTLYIYNSQGSLQDSFDLETGWTFTGHGCINNYDSNNQQELTLLIKNSSNSYRLNMFNFNPDLTLTRVLDKNLSIQSETATNLFCGPEYIQYKIYSPLSTAKILIYDISDFSTVIYNNTATYPSFTTPSTFGKFKNTAGKMTSSGHPSIFWYMENVGAHLYRTVGFNTDTNTFYSVITIDDSGGTTDDIELIISNLGSPSSNRELIIGNNGGTGISFITTSVYDSSLNLLFTYGSVNNFINSTTPSFCDLNHDGNNELIDIVNNRILVYNYAGTVLYNTSNNVFNSGSTHTDAYLTCADFKQTNSYNELITYNGVYTFDGANFTLDTNLGLSAQTSGQILPVRLRNVLNDIDNLVYWNNLTINIYISSVVTDCGDGFCEVGENQYNCFTDCFSGQSGIQTPQFTILNGFSCVNDSYCLSGICNELNHLCEGKGSGATCTLDAECKSKDCENGICTSIDMKDNIDDMVNLLGFKSTLSKILFAVLVICVLTIGGLSAGATAGGMYGAIIGGLVLFVASLFIVIMVFGWLGTFVVFMFAFFMIIALILAMKLGSGSGG